MITVSALYWPRVRTASQRARAFRLRAEGWTFAAIAKETGIPISTLHQWWAAAKAERT